MSILANAPAFLRSAARTAVQRGRRGPARPGWSFLYQTVVATARRSWMREGGFPEQRRWFEDVGRAAPSVAVERRSTTLGGRPAEWQLPEALPEGAPTVLYLHGGGYCIGSIASHRPLTTRLAATARVRLVSLDYRLAPEHRCPDALDDAVAATRDLLSQGLAANQLFLAGDSAGGGLVLATLQALRDAGDPLPAGAVLLSPWADLTRSLPESDVDYIENRLHVVNVPAYIGELDPADPRVSPALGEMSGLPPLMVLAGGAENLRADAEDVAARAREAGVEVRLDIEPGEIHVYPFFGPINPRAAAALRRIGDWIHRHKG